MELVHNVVEQIYQEVLCRWLEMEQWAVQTFQPLSHANLEVLKTSSEKPGDWDLKPGAFQNVCQIIKKKQYLFESVSFLPF